MFFFYSYQTKSGVVIMEDLIMLLVNEALIIQANTIKLRSNKILGHVKLVQFSLPIWFIKLSSKPFYMIFDWNLGKSERFSFLFQLISLDFSLFGS